MAAVHVDLRSRSLPERIVYGTLLAAVLVLGFFFWMQPERQALDVEPLAAAPLQPAPRDPLPRVDAPKPAEPGPKLVVQEPKILPAPKEIDAVEELDALPGVKPVAFVECARIGTEVKFMKEPTDAFQRARDEKKMVFMMHLSGNLEDQAFT